MIGNQIRMSICAFLLFVGMTAVPAMAGEQGEPVAYILLDSSVVEKNGLRDLEKDANQNIYIVGYQGIALMDKDKDNPVLMTRAYNLKLKKMVKLYLNWSKVIALQILDEKTAL